MYKNPKSLKKRSDKNSSERKSFNRNSSNEQSSDSEYPKKKFVKKFSDKKSYTKFKSDDNSSSDRPKKLIKKFSNKKFDKRTNKESEGDGLIRLNKFIANAGICSRREADEYIKAGLVKVNGETVTELGTKVKPTDEVKFGDSLLKSERKVYLLINKPKDCVTSLDDPHAKKTVYDLIKNACKERIYPVGRLDKNTTGVLLLTNDGELTKKLTHPKYEKKKIYHVFLDKKIIYTDLQQILEGFELEDGFIKADSINYVDDEDKKQVGIEIHSGQNRIVKRIFEHLGYKVVKLDRVYFAGLTKKNLRRGEWRFLTPKEIGILQMGAYE